MPALNIEFSDTEIAELRERARVEGVSLKTLAHDTVVRYNTRAEERALIWNAFEQGKALSADVLAWLADK